MVVAVRSSKVAFMSALAERDQPKVTRKTRIPTVIPNAVMTERIFLPQMAPRDCCSSSPQLTLVIIDLLHVSVYDQVTVAELVAHFRLMRDHYQSASAAALYLQ